MTVAYNKNVGDDLILPDGQTVGNLLAADRNRKPYQSPVESAELENISHGVREDYDLNTPNSRRAIREAEDNDLDVVFPEANQLQIDIDSDHAFNIFLAMKPLLEKFFAVRNCVVSYSRSGAPKRHITVTLDQPVNNYQRIALQTLMGSDRVREFLSYVQEKQGDPTPILFLEPKGLQKKTDLL